MLSPQNVPLKPAGQMHSKASTKSIMIIGFVSHNYDFFPKIPWQSPPFRHSISLQSSMLISQKTPPYPCSHSHLKIFQKYIWALPKSLLFVNPRFCLNLCDTTAQKADSCIKKYSLKLSDEPILKEEIDAFSKYTFVFKTFVDFVFTELTAISGLTFTSEKSNLKTKVRKEFWGRSSCTATTEIFYLNYQKTFFELSTSLPQIINKINASTIVADIFGTVIYVVSTPLASPTNLNPIWIWLNVFFMYKIITTEFLASKSFVAPGAYLLDKCRRQNRNRIDHWCNNWDLACKAVLGSHKNLLQMILRRGKIRLADMSHRFDMDLVSTNQLSIGSEIRLKILK